MRYLIAVVFIAVTVALARQPELQQQATSQQPTPVAAVTAILDDIMAADSIPGLCCAVWQDGQVTFTRALGMASLEHAAPVTPDTRFRIASISKCFTGTLAARLHEQGRVDIDADIRTCLPDFPETQGVITIRHLLTHAAGIRHYVASDRDPTQPGGSIDTREYRTTDDALALFKDDPLIGLPGDQRQYSTFGFTLIAASLEGATGEPFLKLMREEVTGPLGLESVTADVQLSIIPDRTRPYSPWGSTVVNARPTNPAYKWAGAGLIASAPDLVRFGAAHVEPGFLRAETLEEMFTVQHLNDGTPTGNGFAWGISTDSKGRRVVQHSGNRSGARAMLIVWPDEEIAVALVTNLTGRPKDILDLTRTIGELFIDGAE